MEIRVERKWKKESYTIGNLYVDGKKICNTLEDKDRGLNSSMTESEIAKRKVYGETAIPVGRYNVGWTYSNKFKKCLPEVYGVRGYAGIRIHSGNTAKDSLGCILLGKNTEVGKITQSRACCDVFNSILQDAIKRKEKVTLTIV